MPQTRFVLRKSLALNKKVIVVVNKIDRDAARQVSSWLRVYQAFVRLLSAWYRNRSCIMNTCKVISADTQVKGAASWNIVMHSINVLSKLPEPASSASMTSMLRKQAWEVLRRHTWSALHQGWVLLWRGPSQQRQSTALQTVKGLCKVGYRSCITCGPMLTRLIDSVAKLCCTCMHGRT